LGRLSVGWLACAGVLALSASSARASSGCAGANARPTSRNARTIEHSILCLVDRLRHAHGLSGLHSNGALTSVASSEVVSMISSDFFAETGPSGQTPLALVAGTSYAADAPGIAVGENIAWGTGNDTTPTRIVAAWMQSPPHRANILSTEYRDAGVGVTPAVPGVLRVGHRGATYAFEFGVRRF
jgi:uncharacterized protein YkwD